MKQLYILLTLVIVTFLSAQDYCPLNVGNSWVYTFEANGQPMPSETLTRTLIDDTLLSDTTCYLINQVLAGNIADTTMTMYFADIGNDVIYIESLDLLNGTPNPGQIEKYSQHTYVQDDFWISSIGDTALVDYVGNVTLNEMIYNNCYKTTSINTNGDSTVVYHAPDIGMLKTDMYVKQDDDSYRNYAWVLKDYELNPVSNSKKITNKNTVNNALFSYQKGSVIKFHLDQSSIIDIKIFSLNGKKHYVNKLTNTKSLNLKDINLSNGIYMVEVSSGQLIDRKSVHFLR